MGSVMNCAAILSRLDDHLDGYLAPIERTAVDSHLRGCRRCSEALAEIQDLRRRLRELPVPSPDIRRFHQAIAAAAEAEHRRRLRRWTGVTGGALAASLVVALGLDLRNAAPGSEPAALMPAVVTATQAEHPVSAVQAVSYPQEPASAFVVPLYEEREISLALDSPRRIEDATFTVQLPEGMELAGYPDQREISWRAPLESGQNLLVLPIRARAGGGGDLVTRIADTAAEQQRSLTLRMEVMEVTEVYPQPSYPPAQIVTAAEPTVM